MTITLLLLLYSLIYVSDCFLSESNSSYAQFLKWNVALNGSLEFEFKTEQPNGLLLYTDDGGTYDFFEIKLVEGALRLRYNLGGGAQIITIGRELNNGCWHKVSVKRSDSKTMLTVDDVSQSRTSKGKEFHFGNLATNSDVYVGGMPPWYNTKLTRLALPSVIFEPRFDGLIRNLVYIDSESTIPKRQRSKRSSTRHLIKDSNSNVSVSSTDICETEDPCRNGGICITTDNGPICDCRNIEFEGKFCEKEKTPLEATFYGKEYIEYNLSVVENEAAATNQETISFHFRTKYANGFLFHSDNNEDYLNIIIKDGGVSVSMKMTTGKVDLYIKPNKIRFDDYRWHRVVVQRRVKEISAVTSFCRVSLTVDAIYSEHASTAGTFTMLLSSKLFVGGSAHARTLPGSSINQNFVGCLRKMLYEIDNLKIDIFEYAKSGSKLVSIGGQLSFTCRTSDASDAITFTTQESYLVLPDWDAAQAGTFAIKFRTTEPHGLLVFGKAQGTFSDVFAIELVEGQIYMIMDLGAGTVKEQVGIGKMNDGLWHSILIHREGRNGRVAVDGFGIEFSLPGESRQLDLGSGLFIGGLPWQRFVNDKFPVSIWSGVLKRGYVGCIRELILNDEPVDVVKYTEEQDIESIEPVCRVDADPCTSSPCFNQGECVTGWNRFTCDCSRTEFSGPTCSKVSSILHFNGTQHMLIKMPANTTYQVEHLSIRFRTLRPAGLLFAASHKSGDRIEIGVFGGKIRLSVQINNREKNIVNGDQLNDNMWHTVKYLRYGAFLLTQVDNRRSVKMENVFTEFDIIHVNNIHIGGYVEVADDQLPLISARLPKFIGAIQRMIFNDIDFIETSQTSYLHQDDIVMPRVQSNAIYTKEENLQTSEHRAFTVLSKNTFVGLSPFKSFSTLNIYFQFKTKEPNGLIVYSGGKKNDYLAVELASGHIYVFLQIKTEIIKIKDGAKSSFSDNRWHTVSIRQPTWKIYTLQVDDIVVAAMKRHDMAEETLQLSGILYVAGVPNDMRSAGAKPLRSKYGFQGCLANVHLNGESPDLIQDALLPSTLIVAGCEGTGKRCNHNACDNRGICVQQWNSQICDCSMTSYTGPTCSEESVAYEFGPGRGIITYTFPEDRRPEMKSDVLALAFVTDKDDSVLFRVDSGTSNDYLELEIVEGNIFMVYNMGTQDQPIGEIGTKVNDNSYHIIRFTRNGANSTLQLDDFNTQTIYPAGHQLSVFNNQATIQIGGKWNRVKQRTERPFGGIITGLVFNGLRILDLAYEKDRRTEIRGDVNRVTTIKNRLQEPLQYQQMQPTPTSEQSHITDDLIFSGAGSGCNVDDEDHCKVAVESSSDDLITPVYVAPTRRPHPPKKIDNNDVKPCDDEDCIEGSGEMSNRVPVPNIPSQTSISTAKDVAPTFSISTISNTLQSHTTATISPFTPHMNFTSSIPIVTVVSVGTIPVQNDSTPLNMFPFYGFINQTMKKVKNKLTKLSSFAWSTTTSTHEPHTTLAETLTTTTTPYQISTTATMTTRRYTVPSRPPLDHTVNKGAGAGARAHEASAAITIIIISAVLIVIIVITILVLLFNRKTETSYKIESHKSFTNQTERKPCSVLLPNESRSHTHTHIMQSNLLIPPASTNNNMRIVGKAKKRQDVKEWYV